MNFNSTLIPKFLNVNTLVTTTQKTFTDSNLKSKQFIDVAVYNTSNPEINNVLRIYTGSSIGFSAFKGSSYYMNGWIKFDNSTGTITYKAVDLIGWTSSVLSIGNIAYF